MKLIKFLEEEIERIKTSEFPHENEYRFYESFSKAKTTEPDLSLLKSGGMLFSIIVNVCECDFEIMFDFFKGKTVFFNKDCDEHEIAELLDSIINLSENNLIDRVLSYDEGFIKTYLQLNRTLKEKTDNAKNLINYKKLGLRFFEDYDQLKIFTKIVKDNIKKIFAIYVQYINYKNNYLIVKSATSRGFKQFCKMLDINEKSYKRCVEIYDIADLSDFLRQMSDKNHEFTKLRKKFDSDNKKRILLYGRTIKLLESMSEDVSIEIPLDMMNKLDDEVLIELLKIILNNDRKVYTNLQIENIKKNHYNEIETKFLQNNIDINKLKEEEKNILISNIKLEVLDRIIVYLNKPEWKWLKKHPNFVQILLNTNESIFESITYWLNNRIVSMETIQNNIGILIGDNNVMVSENDVIACYNKVRENMLILNKLTELANKTYKNSKILFMDTSILKQLVELIKKYKLNLKNENVNSYGLDIITDVEKFDDLDKFIELGFTDYIVENVQLLNENSRDIIRRLSIMANTGLNPYSTEDRISSSIVTGKNFFVSNDELSLYSLANIEEYVIDENYDILRKNNRLNISKETLNLDIVKYLDNMYKVSELEYSFDDIIISRIKFLRNLECLINNGLNINEKTIFSALTYKSNLDLDVIEFINKAINEFNGIQKRK